MIEHISPEPIEFISWDPGKTTGMAAWSKSGDILKVNQFNQTELNNFLENLEKFSETNNIPKVFIIEEYRIYANKATQHIGSKIETVQVIGQLKAFARKHKIQEIEQPATIKNIARKWSGIQLPNNHAISHWADAYLHGYYYLHKFGLIKARVLEDTE